MRLRFLGVVAMLLSASVALADGCYIPKRAVRKFPEIPAQRAVLSWAHGVETLVISSALDSEAQKLGWIIPIPFAGLAKKGLALLRFMLIGPHMPS